MIFFMYLFTTLLLVCMAVVAAIFGTAGLVLSLPHLAAIPLTIVWICFLIAGVCSAIAANCTYWVNKEFQ